jgi:LmbE family N-acetylglucosaminyl deacetylase
MHYTDLAHLPTTYAHVYLSPHLDDAALSCGGMIAQQRDAGEGVLVVTLCTGAPHPAGPFSALAEEFHREWGLAPAQVLATRLAEDAAALRILGADGFAAGMLDAIYRAPELYASRDTLFHTPAAADPLHAALADLFARLRAHLPQAVFYAPLGVGEHVDHQITGAVAATHAGAPLVWYEDFPYVARSDALETRLAQLARPLRPVSHAIDAGIERKIAAVLAYGSQIAELAHSQLGRPASVAEAPEVMAAAVRAYAQSVRPDGSAYGERVWSENEK